MPATGQEGLAEKDLVEKGLGEMGLLARTHEGEPGLPRGRTGLPAEEVRAAQRDRLLRAVLAAVATAGFGDLTVADIVRGTPGHRARCRPR